MQNSRLFLAGELSDGCVFVHYLLTSRFSLTFQGNLESAREAFEAFFKLYPYCYGYWKKYADTERKHGDMTDAEKVYERGLAAIPLSVDLWIHYINFYNDFMEEMKAEDTEEQLRR